ncbi:MAG: hypothetical protein AB1791_13305 [Chloroflexota bacterium]
MYTRKLSRVVILGTVMALLVAIIGSVGVTSAHDWICSGSTGWHWNKYGSSVTIRSRNTALYSSEASSAINDWSNNTILYVPQVTSNYKIRVYDGNYGNTGWGGLAVITNYTGCHILRGDALLNYYYYYSSISKQGIFCQEVGHLWGLDHSNDGCMGKGYYNDLNTTVQHNWDDIYNKYRYTHHGMEGQGERPTMVAYWHNNPATLADAAGLSTNVVVARVARVERAPDLLPTAAGVDTRIPTSRVILDVTQSLKGDVTGGQVSLFFTGADGRYVAGDRPYQAGETYVLFLQPRGDGTYLTISPLGRYQVVDGTLAPAAYWGFAPDLAGRTVGDLAGLLAASD